MATLADSTTELENLLGNEAEELLTHTCKKIPKEQLHLPGVSWVDQITMNSDRNNRVLGNLTRLFNHGRLSGSGYLSILPVDQGVEHAAGVSFAPNPIYFDPENIVRLAIEAGCNGVASTYGILSQVARKYAHKLPFILKINHNELLSYPNTYDQILFSSVKQAFDMGCVAIGATIYFGSPESHRQIQEISDAFEHAHELGMGTILWCYLRNPVYKIDDVDYHSSADLTGQANYLGATIGADIIKQKLPKVNHGYEEMNRSVGSYGKWSEKIYDDLSTDHPIDLCRYQVANNYMGRVGLINSGGASGKNDQAVIAKTAVINKRAGGMGLICGRKSFQRPFHEGIDIIHTIQDVYLNPQITIA